MLEAELQAVWESRHDRPDDAVDCPNCEEGVIEVEPYGDPELIEYWVCEICEGRGWVVPIPEDEATPLDFARFAKYPWLITKEENSDEC